MHSPVTLTSEAARLSGLSARMVAQVQRHGLPVATFARGEEEPRIHVHDGVLADPWRAWERAAEAPFGTIDLGGAAFHGIAPAPDTGFLGWLKTHYPMLEPSVSFLRRSPTYQREPNYIHHDRDMGEWTALLYLTPGLPTYAGSVFWQHRETGARVSSARDTDGLLAEGLVCRDLAQWKPWWDVGWIVNRAIVFESGCFHSRMMNYGDGRTARLTQIVFGTGRVPTENPACR